jgi:hypothetical protein
MQAFPVDFQESAGFQPFECPGAVRAGFPQDQVQDAT